MQLKIVKDGSNWFANGWGSYYNINDDYFFDTIVSSMIIVIDIVAIISDALHLKHPIILLIVFVIGLDFCNDLHHFGY